MSLLRSILYFLKNKLGNGFLISSFINIVLALLVAFAISTFSQTILICTCVDYDGKW